MNHLGLVKNFVSEGAIQKRRIVAFGTSEGLAAQATSGAGILGVTGVRGASAAGERVDAYMSDIQDVEYGEAISYGEYVTSDADGRAIVAAPAAGAQMEVLGRAMEAGGAGAIGKVHIQPQQITG